MKRWWLVIALVLSIGVNAGILATLLVSRVGRAPAAGPTPAERLAEGLRDRGRPPYIDRMADELRLEGAEREAFIAIQERFFRTMLEQRSRVVRGQRSLRREIGARHPDRAEVDRLLAELGAAHMALERAFVDNLLESRELLNGPQERHFLRFMGRLRQMQRNAPRNNPRAGGG